MAQTTGTTTITRKPKDGKSPVAYEIVPDRTLYTSGETAVLPFKVYKIVGEERTLLHEEIERGIYTLVSLSSGDVAYDKDTDNYILNEQYKFAYGDNCTVKLYNSEHTEIATFTWGFTKEGADGKQGATFSIRKWEDVRIGDRFRVESAEDGVLISDIVIYKDTETGVTSKWICKKAFTVTETTRDDTHISLADANPTKTGSAYWKPFNNFHNVATDLVLADKAIIDNLLLNNMKAYPKIDGEWDTDNPTVEIDGNSGEIRLKGELIVKVFRNTIGNVKTEGNVNIIDLESGGNVFFTDKLQNYIPLAKKFEGVEITIIGNNNVVIHSYSESDDVPFASTTYFKEHFLFFDAFWSLGNTIVKLMSVRIEHNEGDPDSDWKWMIVSIGGPVVVESPVSRMKYNGVYVRKTNSLAIRLEADGACEYGSNGKQRISIEPI
ncbi:MAG: hypothetical protein KBT34_02850 [Prevotella sp.]|nr:hypothetical protein [Candidatus Prevotella equi]